MHDPDQLSIELAAFGFETLQKSHPIKQREYRAEKDGLFPNDHDGYKWGYRGPVEAFGRCICMEWTAYTIAMSEKKARANLIYRYKSECGLRPTCNIKLVGRVYRVD